MNLVSSAAAFILLLGSATCVKVDFYGEALCPYCERFLTHTIGPLFESNFTQYFDFTYYPYGNAKVVDGDVICQHGPIECKVNTLLSCIIHEHPSLDAWLPYTLCVEGHGADSILEAVVSCANSSAVDIEKAVQCAEANAMLLVGATACYLAVQMTVAGIGDQIEISLCTNMGCTNMPGPLGAQLQAEAAAATSALQPPHTYVPWVVVDGVPLGDAFENLLKFVCVAYPHEPKPQACYDVEVASSRGAHAPTAVSWREATQQEHQAASAAA